MRLALLVALALVGLASIVVGVALIYPPAAFIVAGVACVALALVVEVRET